jgi:hypothetical protein
MLWGAFGGGEEAGVCEYQGRRFVVVITCELVRRTAEEEVHFRVFS